MSLATYQHHPSEQLSGQSPWKRHNRKNRRTYMRGSASWNDLRVKYKNRRVHDHCLLNCSSRYEEDCTGSVGHIKTPRFRSSEVVLLRGERPFFFCVLTTTQIYFGLHPHPGVRDTWLNFLWTFEQNSKVSSRRQLQLEVGGQLQVGWLSSSWLSFAAPRAD